jgi:hypothetical protein
VYNEQVEDDAMNRNDFEAEFEAELGHTSAEVALASDYDEVKQSLRQFGSRVVQRTSQVNAQTIAQQNAAAVAFREFKQEYGMDLLDDPVLLKHLEARVHALMRAFPSWSNAERWDRAARDVIKRYGTADSRAIRGMRQARQGARLSSDTESYRFDTGSDDDDFVDESEDAEEAADRSAAIHGMAVARRGRENKVDRARYNEQEVRRRQGNR